MKRIVAAMLGTVVLAAAQETREEKVELRYRFQKGEKFPIRMLYSIGLKLEKVPDAFQGLVGEEPINLRCEGQLQVEVLEVSPEGAARLEGRWRELKAKGNVMVNDIDFAYDAERKGDEKPRRKPEAQDPALPGLFNLEDQLRRMSTEPLLLSVDRRGRVKIEGAAARPGSGALDAMLHSFHGLMGPLPEAPIGRGEIWKGESLLRLPGLGGSLAVAIKSENTLQGEERVGDVPCRLVQSRYAVGNPQGVPFTMKTQGEGEGKVLFRASDGRPAKTQGSLRVRITASVPDPGGGDNTEIKAALKVDQTYEMN